MGGRLVVTQIDGWGIVLNRTNKFKRNFTDGRKHLLDICRTLAYQDCTSFSAMVRI